MSDAPLKYAVKTIWVAEDNSDLLFVIERQLKRLGANVLPFNDPKAAIAQLVAGARPDLIITDYFSPDDKMTAGPDGTSGDIPGAEKIINLIKERRLDIPVIIETGDPGRRFLQFPGADVTVLIKSVSMETREKTIDEKFAQGAAKGHG